ncbi:MAG: hypothetical protein HOO67_04080 [Candidatus Peribacteraceae bacterium]|nr:hypothetical protein [Candidatus Peribacteraceae bacterium]
MKSLILWIQIQYSIHCHTTSIKVLNARFKHTYVLPYFSFSLYSLLNDRCSTIRILNDRQLPKNIQKPGRNRPGLVCEHGWISRLVLIDTGLFTISFFKRHCDGTRPPDPGGIGSNCLSLRIGLNIRLELRRHSCHYGA